MPVTSGVSNDLMMVFSDTVSAGFASLTGVVNGVFGLMIVLVVALTGLNWALSDNRAALASGFGKILLIGFFAYLINDWQGLSETIFAGFIDIGLIAGGSGLSAADFLNPGAIIEQGWQIVRIIGESPATSAGLLEALGAMVDAILIAVAMVGIMLAFAILAIQIVMTLLEFKIVTLAGFVLLPFGIWSRSAFLAERPLGYVVSASLKVLALAIIISGARAVFDQLTPSPEADVYEALTILTASMFLAALAIFAPGLAAALITGGPNLGAGSAISAGLLTGGAGAVTGAAAWGAARAAARLAGGGFAGAARAAAGAGAPRGSPPPAPGAGSPRRGGPAGPSSVGGAAQPSASGGGSGWGAAGGSAGGGAAPAPAARASTPPSAASATPHSKRDAAVRAFLLANTGRQLLPGHEATGSVSPDFKKED
jgi:type IV secretion system protein TrbL